MTNAFLWCFVAKAFYFFLLVPQPYQHDSSQVLLIFYREIFSLEFYCSSVHTIFPLNPFPRTALFKELLLPFAFVFHYSPTSTFYSKHPAVSRNSWVEFMSETSPSYSLLLSASCLPVPAASHLHHWLPKRDQKNTFSTQIPSKVMGDSHTCFARSFSKQ